MYLLRKFKEVKGNVFSQIISATSIVGNITPVRVGKCSRLFDPVSIARIYSRNFVIIAKYHMQEYGRRLNNPSDPLIHGLL
jgi:hypothetical protein